jgi:NAD-dependent SIR2 family protein deacetylase
VVLECLQSRELVLFVVVSLFDLNLIFIILLGSGLWTGALGYVVLGWFGTPVGWKWTPQFAWSQYIDKFYNPIRDAEPNEGHYALAELAKIYRNMKIITQNVDGLHQKVMNIL